MKHDGQVELAFAFGPFSFDPHRRLLSRADTPLALGSRARDVLLLLLNRAGETVLKRELLSHVWPGTLAEEGTLRVHIAALRKALRDGEDGGPRYVENVTGLGYRFIAPVSRVSSDALPHLAGSAGDRTRVLDLAGGAGALSQSPVVMALEPWAEMVGAPMARELLDACARIDPENEGLYRKVVHECVAAILGDQASAEVFLLALDGLLADQPSMEVLEYRTQLLAARFAPRPSKKGARS